MVVQKCSMTSTEVQCCIRAVTRAEMSGARVLAMPLFHWTSRLLILPPQSSQLQETGVQKGVFGLDRFDGLTD